MVDTEVLQNSSANHEYEYHLPLILHDYAIQNLQHMVHYLQFLKASSHSYYLNSLRLVYFDEHRRDVDVAVGVADVLAVAVAVALVLASSAAVSVEVSVAEAVEAFV